MQFLDSVLTADSYTWSVASFLCIIATGFVCSAIGNALMSVIVFPALMFGGLVAVQVFRDVQVIFAPDQQLNIAMSLCIGMMLTLITLLVIARTLMLLYGLTIRVQPRPQS